MPEFGKVVAQFTTALVDSSDPDLLPDLVGMRGSITFTLNTAKVIDASATPNPVVITPVPIKGVLNVDGYLCTPLADGSAGAEGIWLMATDDPDLNPTDLQYIVSYALTDPAGKKVPVPSHTLALPTDTTIDLALIISPAEAPAIGISAALAAAAAAAASSASSVKGLVAGSGIIIDDSDPQHPEVSTGGGSAVSMSDITEASTADRQRSNHTGTQTSSTISDLTEAVQDAVAALLSGTSGVTLSYNDAANTLTITGSGAAGLDAEGVRDAIGIAIVGTGVISIAVNDAADTITISSTATANDTDANLKNRANHTGTQAISTITGLQSTIDANTAAATAGFRRRNLFPARGAVVFGWDDGYTVQNTLLDNAAARGQKHTIYVVSNNIGVGTRMSSAAILAHAANGHEIAAHSVTHTDMTAMSAASAYAEMVNSKSALETLIGGPVDSFAYPLGLRNDTLDAQAYGIFGNIRGVSTGLNLPVLNNMDGFRPFLHAGYSWGSTSATVAQAMNMVRLAASEPVIVSFFTHRPDDASEPTTAQIIALMDLCDALGVPVITAREAYGAMGGLLRNPGFQDGLNDWNQVPGTGSITVGSDHASFKSKLITFTGITSTGSSPYLNQLLPVEPLKSYTLSARAAVDRVAGTGGFYTRFTWYNAKMVTVGSAVQSTVYATNTEAPCSLVSAAPVDARYVRADLLLTNCQGTAVVAHPFFGETAYGNFG